MEQVSLHDYARTSGLFGISVTHCTTSRLTVSDKGVYRQVYGQLLSLSPSSSYSCAVIGTPSLHRSATRLHKACSRRMLSV